MSWRRNAKVAAVLVAAFAAYGQQQTQPSAPAKARVGIADTVLPPMQEVLATDRPVGNTDSAPPEHGAEKREQGGKRDLVFAPIPMASQLLGVGAIPMMKYVFSLDPADHKSQPSSLNLAGLITSNGSWGLGGGASVNFRHDQIRTAFYTGYGSMNYDLFGIGTDAGNKGEAVKIDQNAYGVFAQSLFRIFTGFYAGPRFIWGHTNVDVDLSEVVPPDIAPVVDDVKQSVVLSSLGYNVQHDRRDSLFYPTKGHFFQATGDFRASAFGSDRTFQMYQFGYNHYLSFSPKDMLALRAMGCGVTGAHVPFYAYCQFGMQGDNRGYETGRYRDQAMFATQAEYRRTIYKRWGGTAFFGVGEVAPDGGSFTFGNLLPSGGLGVRYNLAKQNRINLRADFAYSKTGFSWSMGIGEVF